MGEINMNEQYKAEKRSDVHLVDAVNLSSLEEEAYLLSKEFIEKAKLKKGQLFVVGCSTSEVLGEKIGTASSYSTAKALFKGISHAASEAGVFLATQCCEHLNRAIIRLLWHTVLCLIGSMSSRKKRRAVPSLQ